MNDSGAAEADDTDDDDEQLFLDGRDSVTFS